MTTDQFPRLLEVASEQDKLELQLVHNGRVMAMRAYKDKPGKEGKANWDAAREAYEETVDRLVARYFPEEAPEPAGERFKSRKQAFRIYLCQPVKPS